MNQEKEKYPINLGRSSCCLSQNVTPSLRFHHGQVDANMFPVGLSYWDENQQVVLILFGSEGVNP